jgi:peptide-methionine (S)-S-oxide reductase
MKTFPLVTLLLAGGLATAIIGANFASSAEKAPAKSAKETPKVWPVAQPKKGEEVATFAAGCFWSVEAIFEKLKGVSSVEPGYAGGHVAHPTYEQVCNGTTGHAESVNIIFDPKVIAYRDLVDILLTMRDPTTLNRQGPDVGTQYRSAIFYRSEAQKKDAEAAIAHATATRLWNAPLVIKAEPFKNFYRAEDYHADYYKNNTGRSYCQVMISPKLEELKKKFGAKVKD